MSDNKTVIVNGASSGVGRATALLLAEYGYNLALVARRREKLEETAELASQVAEGEIEVSVITADLTDRDAAHASVKSAYEQFGFINGVANVAGYAVTSTVDRVDPEQLQKMLDANLCYVMYVTEAIWPIFKEQKAGVIVNVSSMASVDPFPMLAGYAAAKTALNMYTRITADVGSESGIQAVSIAPGAIETEMLRGLFDKEMIPEDRALSPEDIGGLIVDCITGERAFEPGEVIAYPSP